MEQQQAKVYDHSTGAFFALVRNRFKYRLFLLSKLPSAYFAGLALAGISEKEAVVSVPYKWFTQNPFKSTYFACLSMAAEMSTGILAMAHVYKRRPQVSMLVVDMQSRFHKKATGLTWFTCNDGHAIREAIQKAINLALPQQVTVTSTGRNKDNEVVAEFVFTWSFKVKGQ
jgi:hypothetical protein